MPVVTSLLLSAPMLVGGPQATFDAPVPLTHGGATFSALHYPTPVLQNVDEDDAAELILGDLMGNVWICDDQTGLGTWSKMEHVTAGGKPLKLNNW